MAQPNETGIMTVLSRHSVAETVERLKGILSAKGVTLFAVVDHSGEAAKAGMSMPDTKLLIFGSPKAGTPVMIAAPSIAIDLPLKILVAVNSTGKVSLSYNSAQYLAERHSVPADLITNLAVIEALANAAAS
ncbi:MAG TPA: DUF302 domain-containing protein [Terracidiphilus sp.]|nr:DUF302 domain-containing protein [Terracidiphilus sp.]